MILLKNGKTLRLGTSSTADVDVLVCWADYTAAGAVVPDETSTKINTAPGTPTTICATPASGDKRTVRFLSVVNIDATTANTVTLESFNGTVASRIFKVTLAAGEMLVYDEGQGFTVYNAQGQPETSEFSGGAQAAVNALNLVVLASDVTNSNAVANTIADVTGLSFAVTAGESYWFRAVVRYTAAATTTGSRWSVNGPASPTRLVYRSQYSLTAATETLNAVQNAYDLPAASNATSATTADNLAIIEGHITPSANGTVVIRFASEVANSAIVAKAGSVLEWVRTL